MKNFKAYILLILGITERQEANSQDGFKKQSSNKCYNESINRFYKPVNVLKEKIVTFIYGKDIDVVTGIHAKIWLKVFVGMSRKCLKY